MMIMNVTKTHTLLVLEVAQHLQIARPMLKHSIMMLKQIQTQLRELKSILPVTSNKMFHLWDIQTQTVMMPS